MAVKVYHKTYISVSKPVNKNYNDNTVVMKISSYPYIFVKHKIMVSKSFSSCKDLNG